MEYVVCHARKVQTAVGLRNVAAHNCREAVYDDALRPLETLPDFITHHDRVAFNQGERCGGDAVLARRTARIKDANLARKPQKNAAAAIEIAISASPAWFEGKKPKEWQDYLSDARRFIEKRYGKENVLHWAVHCDEKTPHLHILLAPIVESEKGLKYTSSGFLGGKAGLANLQRKIWENVGQKYGLERGVEGSKSRHTDQFEWAAEVARERESLAIERGGLDIRQEELRKRESQVEAREVAVASRERLVNGREARVIEREADLQTKTKDFAQQEEDMKSREGAQAEFQKALEGQLQGWDLPEAHVFETAKAYAKRIRPEVLGKVVAATETEQRADRDKEIGIKVATDKLAVDLRDSKTSLYAQKQAAERARKALDELRERVMASATPEALMQLQRDLRPNTRKDIGISR